MKAIPYIITALVVVFFKGCARSAAGADGVLCQTILLDVSDTHSVVQTISGEDLSFFAEGTYEDFSKGFRMMILPLGDKRFEIPCVVYLPPAKKGLLSNSLDRKREVGKALSQIDSCAARIREVQKGTSKSLVWASVNSSLNELAACKNCKGVRRFVLISDCIENNPDHFSAYNERHLQMLLKHPEYIMNQIDSLYPIKHDLSQIEVVIYHQPQGDEELFATLSSFLQQYLTTRGVREVRIITSLDMYQ